ncbi:MAG TPA: hypothetical protein VF267_01515, partial [Gammaproteobacteria bacterium]
LSAAHYKAMDDAAREPLPSFSGEYSAIEPQIKQLFDKVSGFENAVVQPVREKVDAFVEKYGDENEATIKLREVTDDLWYLNSSLSWLQSALERWDEYRLNIADNLAQQASTSFLLGEYATDHSLRDEHYRAAKPWAEWALRFNPDHEKAKEYLARADSQAASAESAFKAAIQDAQWPGDAFDPGGGTEAMKMKILRYFQKHHSGSDHDQGSRYFAVRLRHDWYISQTNILDQATEWRISAYLAKTVPGDAGHAEVELVEIGTQTGDRNSGFAKRYFQSDSYLIPIERVPADDPEILQESLKLISK